MINVFQPTLGEEELQALRKVFESNWIGKGKLTALFEEEYAKHIGSSKANVLSTNCCSEGLFSSMHLCGVEPGDEVILPTISFVGAGNAVCANGSKMVLCDVDRHTMNATAADIEKCITPKTKAVLLLHHAGNACDMDSIMDLVSTYKLKLIEDTAAGVCSTYKGKALGTFGDMGMWSFDAMKILVCGDGAILHFNTPELREKAEKWLYFGLENKSGYSNSVDKKWWEFDISCFGHRAIMNDMTAAVALEQLKKLPYYMERRKKVNDFYNETLKDISWIDLPKPLPEGCESSYYFYQIQVSGDNRDKLAKYLRDNGIYTTYRYFPLHRVKGYRVVGGDFVNADYAADHTLNLPMHQSLSDDDLSLVVEMIHKFGKINNL